MDIVLWFSIDLLLVTTSSIWIRPRLTLLLILPYMCGHLVISLVLALSIITFTFFLDHIYIIPG
ncbi:hypothetical protein EDB19DRAFT_1795682 [Suillus lakei]|nr:hypothetical protein EDB19DRAFT_1795682 [Suillus lakei]